MKELPSEWFIEVTKDNFDIIDKWVYDFKGYHPTIGKCVSFRGTWCDRYYYQNSIPEITIEQFKKHILKEDMEQLPKQWVVWNDGSQLFKDTVVHYLNTHYSAEFKGWVKDSWYGVIANQKYQADILVSDPVKITIQEFIKLTTKNMKTELLGLPVIRGEKHHLEAFLKDCEKLGYKTHKSRQTSNTRIQLNGLTEEVVLRDEDAFKILYFGEEEYSKLETLSIKEFQLPSDWSKCLDFMKENMDRWLKIQEESKEPEFKIGDIVTIKLKPKNWDSGAGGQYPLDYKKPVTFPFTGKIENIVTDWKTSYNISGYGFSSDAKIEPATPQEIEEYNNKPKIFKMTSTSGNFELEVSKKGVYYRPEDKYLNVNDIDSIRYPLVPNICYSNGRMGHYPTQITKVDVGCKKDTLVSEWKQVYDYYKSITQ